MYSPKQYKNFRVATYVHAYYLEHAEDEQIRRDIEKFLYYVPLTKVYIENHRATTDISQERLTEVKKIFESYGLEVSGGITSTGLVGGRRKPSIFDTFCYTDPKHRARYLQIVEQLAGVVDEIILDDFFFTACRCEMCIKAKGIRSWSQYRLKLMEDFSKEVVAKAKEVNPNMNFIIKYPAWFKSYHETGYYPEKQKDIFDMIYTGTETREAVYNTQHLQRYHSYSIMRLEENMAPGKNGGGWIDPDGSGDNINRFLEQADHTLFAKAKELMIFNFQSVLAPNVNVIPALGWELERVDRILEQLGKPIGVSAYEPFNSDGEDLVYTYLGMGGIAVEPVSYFNENAETILITASCSHDENILEKIQTFLIKGGTIVMTNGFLHAMYEKGIRDLCSIQTTGRFISGKEYLIGSRNCARNTIVNGADTVPFEFLQYKDNAASANITVCCNEFNGPILTEEDYGNGRIFVLNLPENYADLYKLPEKVWETIAKYISIGQDVYVASDEKCSFFAYDNNVYGLMNYASHGTTVHVLVRGACKGLQDIETGEIMDMVISMPLPEKMSDSAAIVPEKPEYKIEVNVEAGAWRFFRVI